MWETVLIAAYVWQMIEDARLEQIDLMRAADDGWRI